MYGGLVKEGECKENKVLWEYSVERGQWRWINTGYEGDWNVLMNGNFSKYPGFGVFNESFGGNNYPSYVTQSFFWNFGNSLLLFGGKGYFEGEYAYTGASLNALWEFSIEKKQWRWIDYTHGNKSELQKVESFDMRTYKTYESFENLPPGRFRSCGVKNNPSDELGWMFGGGSSVLIDKGYFNYTSLLWKYLRTYDSNIQQLTAKPSNIDNYTHYDSRNYPSARDGHSCWMKDNRLYLFGGYFQSNLDDFWIYSVDKNQWKVLNTGDVTKTLYPSFNQHFNTSNHPTRRQYGRFTLYNERLYLFSGYGYAANDGNPSNLCDLWEYSIKLNLWRFVGGNNITMGRIVSPSYVGNLKHPGSHTHSIFTSISNYGIVLFGGRDNNDNVLSSMWRLNIDYSCYNKSYDEENSCSSDINKGVNTDSCSCFDEDSGIYYNGKSCHCSSDFCNYNGVCRTTGYYASECTCNDDYFTEKNGNCDRPICYDYPAGDSLTCNEHGECMTPSNCSCYSDEDWYGISCEEKVQGAVFKDNNKIVVGYLIPTVILEENKMNTSFHCSRIIDDIVHLGISIITNDEGCFFVNDNELHIIINDVDDCLFLKKNGDRSLVIKVVSNPDEKVYLTIVGDVEKSKMSFLEENMLYVIIGMTIILAFVAIVLTAVFFKKYRHLKVKQDKIDGLDIILEEDAVSKKGFSFNVDKSLFVISMSDIKLEDEIASGSGGIKIYKCNWKGKDAVLKMIHSFQDSTTFDEFQKELKLMSALSHPNIIQFYGYCIKHSKVGIVMEWCPKGNLKEYYMENGKEIRLDDRVNVMNDVVLGMEYLHDRNVIHRDLKLENILLNDELVPKIMDFGISKVVTKKNERHTKRIGTSLHMAPEILIGRGKYSNKVDVFSFGMILFIIVTLNFDPYSDVEIEENISIDLKIANDKNFRPSFGNEYDYPTWLVDLIKSCWENDPKDRPSFHDINITMSMSDFDKVNMKVLTDYKM